MHSSTSNTTTKHDIRQLALSTQQSVFTPGPAARLPYVSQNWIGKCFTTTSSRRLVVQGLTILFDPPPMLPSRRSTTNCRYCCCFCRSYLCISFRYYLWTVTVSTSACITPSTARRNPGGIETGIGSASGVGRRWVHRYLPKPIMGRIQQGRTGPSWGLTPPTRRPTQM